MARGSTYPKSRGTDERTYDQRRLLADLCLFLFSGGLSLATTFDALLDSYRGLADSERMKGNYFEQPLGRYLSEGEIQK